MDQLKDRWYRGRDGSDYHQHQSRNILQRNWLSSSCWIATAAAGNSRTACSRVHRAMDLLSDYQTFQRGYASAEVESRVPSRTARRCGQLLAKKPSPRTQGEYAAQPQKCSSLYRLFVQLESRITNYFSADIVNRCQSCFVQLQQFGCKAPLQYPFTLFSVPCA